MISIQDALQELRARIPELEWKLGQLKGGIAPSALPKGLFRTTFTRKPEKYIAEIKEDLEVVSQESNPASVSYLVNKLDRKITVLVRWCQLQSNAPSNKKSEADFGIAMIITRQQWLKKMEAEIAVLQHQVDSLSDRLLKVTDKGDTELMLSLQSEYGKATQRLTLAQEKLNRQLMDSLGLMDS